MTTIYIRTLKHAEHTVFCVADGQKTYYDPQFDSYVPYSSGQQVKRSILEKIGDASNEQLSPITFISNVKAGKGNKMEFDGEGIAYGTCNPLHFDQLLGGWMKAEKGGASKTLKRRSPLSISAMRGLHPLLAETRKETGTFDRKERGNSIVKVMDTNGNELTDEQIENFLSGRDSQVSLKSKYLKPQNRATGLFVQDIAVDLRRLFCVSLDSFEPEIDLENIEPQLREAGWEETETVFGKCLVAPKKEREKLAKALAYAIVNWSITSNQSRTFSLMETLAISISDNANKIAGSIRAKLSEEEDRKAIPIIEEEMKGVETYVTLQAGAYIRTKKESAEALEQAEKTIYDKIMAFEFENQLA